MSSPTVSVILPFFRNPLVAEAVSSILAQTFVDFELIAIDDCSGNGVADLLRGISDPRLRLVEREVNGGENATRNHGISLARGKYVAFQDHDDFSYPGRLAAQVEYLESHPDVLGCGTACHYGDEKVHHTAPEETRELLWSMIFNNHVMFPTVMVRTEVAQRHPFGNMVATDDYRWLFEVLAEGKFANLPEILFHYRMQPTSLSREKAEVQLANLDICRARFAATVGVECGTDEIRLLRWLGTPRQEPWPSVERIDAAGELLRRLVDGFLARHPGAESPIRSSARDRLRFAATVSANLGPRVWRSYRRHRARLGMPFSADEAKLALKCALGGLGLLRKGNSAP
jgi:glycosyltransferase involved in cell wall biosynthesis